MASARDIVSSIISAANKKIQRRRKNQDEIDNGEHDNDKVNISHNLFVNIIAIYSIYDIFSVNLGQDEARIGKFADDSTKYGFERTTVLRQ